MAEKKPGVLTNIISITGSLFAFLIITGALYYFQIIFFVDTIYFLAALILSSIAIVFLRLIFKKKRENTKSLEKKLSHKFGSSKKNAFMHMFHELEERKFASAHVARIAIIASGIYYITNNLVLGIVLLAYALLVGIARVRLKRHSGIDIFFGLIIGIVSIFLIYNVFFWIYP